MSGRVCVAPGSSSAGFLNDHTYRSAGESIEIQLQMCMVLGWDVQLVGPRRQVNKSIQYPAACVEVVLDDLVSFAPHLVGKFDEMASLIKNGGVIVDGFALV